MYHVRFLGMLVCHTESTVTFPMSGFARNLIEIFGKVCDGSWKETQ